MSMKKPQPLIPDDKQDVCPVCGEKSYSQAGVHPQCSVRQADEQRMETVQRELKKPKTQKPPEEKPKPWQRVCPKCKSLQHVRKRICVCGYELISKQG
jgi:RNA polymerase subunit RPABC4/transcription elongation factor Spt4